MHLDPVSILKATGYIGLFLMIFAESGLLIGLFFPGDSLLFTAGFLASQNILNLGWVMVAAVAGAIAGVSGGYWLGQRFGPKIFKRKQSLFFSPDYIQRSEDFYEQHGRKTIILARFVPIVRTIAPVLAGVGKMRYQVFIAFNIIGGLLWGAGIPLLGYYLGKRIPSIDHYLLPIIAVILILSVMPTAIHLIWDPQHKQHLKRVWNSRSKRRH